MWKATGANEKMTDLRTENGTRVEVDKKAILEPRTKYGGLVTAVNCQKQA